MNLEPDPKDSERPGCVECGRPAPLHYEWKDTCPLCEGALCPPCARNAQGLWEGLCSACAAEEEEETLGSA